MATTGPLNDQARAIVEAVLEAIDIPHAATVGEAEKRQAILTERLRLLVAELRSIARSGVIELPMTYLAEGLAKHPVDGYLTTAEALQRTEDGATWDEAVGAKASRRVGGFAATVLSALARRGGAS